MAESTKTGTTPGEQANKWQEYFNSNPSGITNSTGYQLYAVNEQTVSGLTDFDKFTDNTTFETDTLNLQFADVAYNTKAISRK